jgi:hypothetical protein
MDLSIVTTLYYSSPYLEEFYARTCAAAEQITDDYEIILVNDGSPDDSLDVALSLFERDDRVKVVDLSRNFGHHKAVMTGLAHARGDLVFKIDCDLEEEPELLGEFYAEMIKDPSVDVVYGVQQRRKGGPFERLSGSLFYRLFNLLSDHPVPSNLPGGDSGNHWIQAGASRCEEAQQGKYDLYSGTKSLSAGQCYHFIQQSAAGLRFLFGMRHCAPFKCCGALPDCAASLLRYFSYRLAVADRVRMVAGRVDHLLLGSHRYLPVEGVYGSQATALHGDPAAL